MFDANENIHFSQITPFCIEFVDSWEVSRFLREILVRFFHSSSVLLLTINPCAFALSFHLFSELFSYFYRVHRDIT